jgi:glycine cleavage system H protein
METVRFRHAHFTARFPVDCLYSPSHFWMRPAQDEGAASPIHDRPFGRRPGVWRVGFTRFATRMLGELVEMVLDVEPGAVIRSGDRLGTVEGFKAVSDLYAVVEGAFERGNPAIHAEACLTHSDPHAAGWLYAIRGTPEPGALDVHGYIELLAGQIDRLQASRYSGGAPDATPPFTAEDSS